MHDTLIIIGASGHGKVVADIALKMKKWKSIYFLDDNPKLDEVLGIKVIGKIEDADKYNQYSDYFVAIGDNKIRAKIIEKLQDEKKSLTTLIHPSAVIGTEVTIGDGTVVMPGVVINPYTTIGRGCIVNTSSIVEHDNHIYDYVHISPGVRIGGKVIIEESTWIGIGSTIINNIRIVDNCVIGAGTVVIKDVIKPGVYTGVPAKINSK